MPAVREILIGRRADDHVLLGVRGRLFPADQDEDPLWLWTSLTVRLGGFSGQLEGGVRADELRRLRNGIEALYDRSATVATLATEDGWLTVELTSPEAADTVEVELRVHDQDTPSNELRGALYELSRESLVTVIESLVDVERAYPVS
jgi:hypothetical protein